MTMCMCMVVCAGALDFQGCFQVIFPLTGLSLDSKPQTFIVIHGEIVTFFLVQSGSKNRRISTPFAPGKRRGSTSCTLRKRGTRSSRHAGGATADLEHHEGFAIGCHDDTMSGVMISFV